VTFVDPIGLIRSAMGDPGQYCPRGDGESVPGWGARAAAIALTRAGVRLAMPGEVVVRLPEIQDTGTDSSGAVWTHCGQAYGQAYPDLATAGLPGLSMTLDDARARALELLAVAEHMQRATSPAEPTAAGDE